MFEYVLMHFSNLTDITLPIKMMKYNKGFHYHKFGASPYSKNTYTIIENIGELYQQMLWSITFDDIMN